MLDDAREGVRLLLGVLDFQLYSPGVDAAGGVSLILRHVDSVCSRDAVGRRGAGQRQKSPKIDALGLTGYEQRHQAADENRKSFGHCGVLNHKIRLGDLCVPLRFSVSTWLFNAEARRGPQRSQRLE